MSRVSLVRTGGNLLEALGRAIEATGERPIARGDHVLIKPNLVEPADPDSGQITTARLIEAAARYCLDCGAKRVTIGEGPSYYVASLRLRDCFTRTGVAGVADRLGIEWAVFDEHGYRTFENVSEATPDEFWITEYAFSCDKFINLPVLKTHYLTRVTLAMKNLKGCLKREDKPLFHEKDLSRAIVELCRIIRPTINVIDCTPRAIVRQLGTGCSNWKQAGEGLLVAGADIVAVDSVGCALMGIDPVQVPTVRLGAAAGLGECDLTRIDIAGEELKRLKFRVRLPEEELREAFPLLDIAGADRACSGCLIPLLSALRTLGERGVRPARPVTICMGKGPCVPDDREVVLVGDCAAVAHLEAGAVSGCPPDRDELLSALGRVSGPSPGTAS